VFAHGVREFLEAALGGHAKGQRGQTVEDGPTHVRLFDVIACRLQVPVGRELHRRRVPDREQALSLERLQIPPDTGGDTAELVGGFLQRKEHPTFSLLGPGD
jgi:hypothetical protein